MAANSARYLASTYFSYACDPSAYPAWVAARSQEALLARAELLLAEAAGYLPRLRPWVPHLTMQAMDTFQNGLKRSAPRRGEVSALLLPGCMWRRRCRGPAGTCACQELALGAGSGMAATAGPSLHARRPSGAAGPAAHG